MDWPDQQSPYPEVPPEEKHSAESAEMTVLNKVTYTYPSHTTTVAESMTLAYGSDQDEFPDRDIQEMPQHDVITEPQATCITVSDDITQRGSGHKVPKITQKEKLIQQTEEQLQRRSSEASRCSSGSKKDAAGVRRKDSKRGAVGLHHQESVSSGTGRRRSSTGSQSKVKNKFKLKQNGSGSRGSLHGSNATAGSEPLVTQDTPASQPERNKATPSRDLCHNLSFGTSLDLSVKASRSCPVSNDGSVWSNSKEGLVHRYLSEEHVSTYPYQQTHGRSVHEDLSPQSITTRVPSLGTCDRVQYSDIGHSLPVDKRIEKIQKQLDSIYERMEQFHELYQIQTLPVVDTLKSRSEQDVADSWAEDIPESSSYKHYSTRATKDSLSLNGLALVAALTTVNSTVTAASALDQREDWANQIMADTEAQQKLDCVKKILQTCIRDEWEKLVVGQPLERKADSGMSVGDHPSEPAPAAGVQSPLTPPITHPSAPSRARPSAPSGAYPASPTGYPSTGLPIPCTTSGTSTPSNFYSPRMSAPPYQSSSHIRRSDLKDATVPIGIPMWQAHTSKITTTKAPSMFMPSGLDARLSMLKESTPDCIGHSTASVHPQFVDISPVLSPLTSPKLSDSDADMTSIDIMRQPYMGIYEPTSQQKLTMTVDKDGRPVSPIHVHVDDQTSVHVHMKKPKKTGHGDHGETKRRSASVHGGSNLRRTGASARARSKSPHSGPWVPPPGKSTKASSLYSWQGQSHRLEIVPHDDMAARGGKMYEMSTDEEDEVTNKMKKYERKIDELMNEVGTLRNEMTLQHSARELSYKDDMLQSTNCALIEKEAEIEDYRRELFKTERVNRTLRQNMGHMQNEAVLNQSERDQLTGDRDMLMKKLVEVEMDGQAAAKQVAALRDSMQRLRQEKQLSSTDSQMLNKQKELLLERLMEFELTNRSLRRMLRERHEEEANSMRLREQRDLLLLKLRETEDAVQRLRTEVLDKSRQIADQRIQMTAQHEETMSISNKQVSLESTRAHLQKQLRQKEADCNRMAVQIRTLESKLAQERIETDHLQGQVEVAREKADRDKEALKKAARVQKHRAAHSEEAVEQANLKLMERDAMMADMRSQIDGLMTCLDKISKEKSQALAENSAFKTRISELEGILTRLEDDTKNKVESATAQLHERTTEVAAAKLENERLKTTLSTVEGKLQLGENEVAQLRNNLTEYERLVEEYRAQTQSFMSRSQRLRSDNSSVVTRTQHQAGDTATELELQRKETAKIQQASSDELDKVKNRLQVRLQELEPIPEMLRSTELQLQEATEKLHSHEARNKESSSLLNELTTKLELQTKDMDTVREKWLSSQDEVHTLKQKLESLDKKMHELEDQNREIMCTVAKKEEAVHQANMRMDEHSRENASLQRQLEAALCDARRLSETARDKISCRDRITQQRILDLEAQVNHLRTEVTRAKREKEEAERKFNSRLYDLKDRLEQAHSTNRSMQNYVQFLKNSYSNVFGDTTLMTTSSPFKTFH